MTKDARREGYLLEHRFSNIQIVDETERHREFPVHHQTIGPVRVFREDLIPSDKKKMQKVTYYKLEQEDPLNPKKKRPFYAALMSDYDQNLTSLSIDATKKQADPKSQKRISQFFLFLSFSFNIFMMAQQSLSPEQQLIIDIDPKNAGWLLFAFAMFKILDLLQERPAIFAVLYVLYWGQVLDPSAGENVEIAFCRILLSDKIRVSSKLPIAIEEEHVKAERYLKEKAEIKAEKEYNTRIQMEHIIEDQKRTIAQTEKRLDAREKLGYVNGLNDATHSITRKNITSDVYHKNPVPWNAFGMGFLGILIYFTFSNLSINFPDVMFYADMASMPWMFWVLLFMLGYLVIRWIFKFLGVDR